MGCKHFSCTDRHSMVPIGTKVTIILIYRLGIDAAIAFLAIALAYRLLHYYFLWHSGGSRSVLLAAFFIAALFLSAASSIFALMLFWLTVSSFFLRTHQLGPVPNSQLYHTPFKKVVIVFPSIGQLSIYKYQSLRP